MGESFGGKIETPTEHLPGRGHLRRGRCQGSFGFPPGMTSQCLVIRGVGNMALDTIVNNDVKGYMGNGPK